MVENLILSARCSFDLPSVARIRTGRGELGCRSGKSESGLLSDDGEEEDVVSCGGVTELEFSG